MNKKTGTCVSSEKEKVKESQSRSVTPSLDTPSGAGLGASQPPTFNPAVLLFNDEGDLAKHPLSCHPQRGV